MLTEQQKQERSRAIGGSDWWGVLSLLPWGCRKKLWLEKTGHEPDYEEFHDDNRFERGHDIEPIAAQKYADKHDVKLFQINKMAYINDKPHCGVHIDRHIVAFDERGPGVLEVKNMASKFQFHKLRHDGVYDAYILQLQWGMHIKGWKWGAFVIFCSETWEFIDFEVDYDPEMGEMLEAKADEFWQEVEGGVDQQGLSDDDKRCLHCNFRSTCKGDYLLSVGDKNAVKDDFVDRPDLAEAVREWDEIDKIEKEAKAMNEIAKAKVKELIGDDQAVISGGQKIYFRESTRRSIDSKFLRSKYSDIADECTKITPIRTLRKYPI